ncbi:MAG: 4a-hydroxytetrahydrobiopterin dehydratase [Candidatus Aenigmatarchaeota archaeon]
MELELLKRKCIPCEGGVEPIRGATLKGYLSSLKGGWELVDERKIRKEFTFSDFKGAIRFVNRVADLAEDEGHHPDIFISYNRVRIELWTHSISGLSENDFIIAAKIDELY